MKIGLSLSQCVVDIYEGTVSIDNILVIVARTRFDPLHDKEWEDIWKGYTGTGNFMSTDVWTKYIDDEEGVRGIVLNLYNQGKLHQPRQYANPQQLRRPVHHWIETVDPEALKYGNPSVLKAWENFELLAGITK